MRHISLLVVLTCAALLTACAATRDPLPPEVRLADLRPVGVGLIEQRFELSLRLVNRNDFALDIDGLTVDLELNGQPFASGVSNRSLTIPRLGQVVTAVEVSTSLLEVLQSLLDVADSGRLSYRISGVAYMTGFAGFGGETVPYEHQGTLALPDIGGLFSR